MYGVPFDEAPVLSSHLPVVRMSYLALATTGVPSRFARHGSIPAPLGATGWTLQEMRARGHDRLTPDTGALAPAGPPPGAACVAGTA